MGTSGLALQCAGQADTEHIHRRFNGRLRDELSSCHAHARSALANWRSDYNGRRPHLDLAGRLATSLRHSTAT
ncbi:integrase core domain-containing protein [Agrobacterium salinitolerans]|uniref:integrase core domain-containing protein n=1 Tax=Agrobacterium salinitolerans TaxID=1183413 RepID=UPI003872E99C